LINYSIDFKESLIWREFYKDFDRKASYFNGERTSALKLNENVVIYVDWQRINEQKPCFYYSVYRKNFAETLRILEEKLSFYEKKFKRITHIISKDLYEKILSSKTINIENKTSTEISFYNPELQNESWLFLGSFLLKSGLKISLYQGFVKEYDNKIYNAFPFDVKNGEILSHFFPRIHLKIIEEFLKEFNDDKEKGNIKHFYHIIERDKRPNLKLLINKTKRIFLYPVENMQNAENFIDFFEEFNIGYDLLEIMKKISLENKGLNVFLTEQFAKNEEEFLEEIIGFLMKINDKNLLITKVNLFHNSQNLMKELFEKLKKIEVFNRKNEKIDEEYQWFFIEESLRGEWRKFEKESQKFIEISFNNFKKNPEKPLFSHLKEGKTQENSAKTQGIKIEIDMKNDRVFIDFFKKSMFLKTFLTEINEKEFAFLLENNEKLLKDYKEIGIDNFEVFALWNKEDEKCIGKLRNNTQVSLFNFKRNMHIIEDMGVGSRRYLIRRTPVLKKVNNIEDFEIFH